MAGWPREIHGHTIARTVDFLRGDSHLEEVVHTYHCTGCGLQFEGPDDPRLREVQCTRLTRSWQP